jgi:hypothetical protein
MLQTILLTALSAQLTFLTPVLPVKTTHQVVFTHILPQENNVNYSNVKNNVTPTVTDYPTLRVTPIPPTAEPTGQPTVITPVPTVAVSIIISSAPSSLSDTAITYLGSCEAGMDPTKNTGNGYYGAFQFSYGTWKRLNTGYERADLAPIEVQEAAVKQLLQGSSIYNQFPGCARKMHSIGLI